MSAGHDQRIRDVLDGKVAELPPAPSEAALTGEGVSVEVATGVKAPEASPVSAVPAQAAERLREIAESIVDVRTEEGQLLLAVADEYDALLARVAEVERERDAALRFGTEEEQFSRAMGERRDAQRRRACIAEERAERAERDETRTREVLGMAERQVNDLRAEAERLRKALASADELVQKAGSVPDVRLLGDLEAQAEGRGVSAAAAVTTA